MNHWEMCIQDIWKVARWVLPPVMFMFTGGLIVLQASRSWDYSDLISGMLIASVMAFVAAMLGWWL